MAPVAPIGPAAIVYVTVKIGLFIGSNAQLYGKHLILTCQNASL
ncbi:hypothetical protein SBF1_870002 [Candidatus Desulfosporosinus infrequens]|uniref:Uncharacterized protein n=1 Tax=Candidatus Desulfosporosinus infrequens TaxID=2043169 RepID=A0A2U3LVE8_9FIRM|nr:hypothetical protein SBF1_870002 [Candidatus Desulfosporosinus infrequens]